jgi:hypothetical protein
MSYFKSFLDNKKRTSRKQLRIIKRVLLQNKKFEIKDYTETENQYLYIKSPIQLSFGGVRLYKIGDTFALRVQNEPDSEPYGKAFILEIEDCFNDLVSESGDELKAGQQSMKIFVDSIINFFEESKKAEDTI